MSQVVPFRPRAGTQSRETRLARLISAFATRRRATGDVFWLKENAEILNILECTGTPVPQSALEPLASFHEGAAERLAFFPQYYRFILSITLDLEDLGLAGETGAALVERACRAGLAEAELSDLQRMEARRLMARRGRDPLPDDTGLEDRLRRFAARPATFALPNKKAAYELTHIVFYLSEYGRRDPWLGPGILTSLHFAGLLAYIEQNGDLLAEICIALRHAGDTPPTTWTDWLARATRDFRATAAAAPAPDAYHEYLVCNWHAALAGGAAFAGEIPDAALRFDRPASPAAPLREMSRLLHEMGTSRRGDWEAMRRHLEPRLSDHARAVLTEAAGSSDRFPAFFEGFSRAAPLGGAA